MTTGIKGEDGRVTAITCTKVDETMQAIEGSEFELKADLILLAMGFIHPVHEGMLDELSLERDGRGNVAATRPLTKHLTPIFLPVATCGAVSRWWFGPFVRVANAPARWIWRLWAKPACPDSRSTEHSPVKH